MMASMPFRLLPPLRVNPDQGRDRHRAQPGQREFLDVRRH